MQIDGKEIQIDIQEALKREFFNLSKKPTLSIIYIGSNPVIEKFISLKKKFGESVGVDVVVHTFDSFDEDKIQKVIDASDAVVVQLPLPDGVDMNKVLNMVPYEKDIDMLSDASFEKFLSGATKRMPPVVGAVAEVLSRSNIDIQGKNVAVIGRGRLVGKPISLWLLSQGVPARILDRGDNLKDGLSDADIVISGAGVPHLVTKEIIKEDAVLIDVGTSSDSGVLKGDIDPQCRDKASVFCGVPGGVGPITIAKLFENILLDNKFE